VIGGHFWREPPQENESRTMIGLFGERNVCRFEAAVCGEERCVTTLKTAAKETSISTSAEIKFLHNTVYPVYTHLICAATHLHAKYKLVLT